MTCSKATPWIGDVARGDGCSSESRDPTARWAMRIDAHGWAFNRGGSSIGTIPAMTDPSPSAPRPAPATGLRRRVPNLLTVLRVLLAGVFFSMLAFAAAPGPALPTPFAGQRTLILLSAGVFILAVITDALDGHLARKWNAVSTFGRVMDPFADKLVVLGAFIFLAAPGFQAIDPVDGQHYQATGVRGWMAVVILARELLVTSIRGVAESAGVAFGASWSGKWKMILQSVVIPVILVGVATFDCRPDTVARRTIDGLVWITVLVTAWSAWPYMLRGAKALREMPS